MIAHGLDEREFCVVSAVRGARMSAIWDDRKAMRLLLTLTAGLATMLAAMIGTTAPAFADSADDAFLAAVRQAGITFPDPARAIGAGRWVCTQVGEGKQTVDVVNTIQSLNSGLSADYAAKFTAIAATAYCPKILANSGDGGAG